MTPKELKDAIDALPGAKVTAEAINARIKGVVYMQVPGTTVTICHIELVNGYSVRGESACVDPQNFNEEIGANLAYHDAFNRLWHLEGYLLAERLYQERLADDAPGLDEQIAAIGAGHGTEDLPIHHEDRHGIILPS